MRTNRQIEPQERCICVEPLLDAPPEALEYQGAIVLVPLVDTSALRTGDGRPRCAVPCRVHLLSLRRSA